MDMYSVLVTGANRGIGLEFVRQVSCLQKPPRYIFATYRSTSSIGALKEIKDASKDCSIVLIEMDVTKVEDIIATRKVVEQTVKENGLTLLINNAATLKVEQFPNLTEESLLSHFTVNTLGPIKMFQEMFPLLEKAASKGDASPAMSASRAAVLNISSMGGSITRTGIEYTQDLVACGYKTSKAALNMAMRVIAANVKSKGILVVNMCPGWVKTAMGSERAEITPEESISAMLETLTKINDTHQDITKLEDIIAARKVVEHTVKENGLTLLINNAGALKSEQFPNLTEESLLAHFTVNTLGPIRMFQEMFPLLEKAASKGDASRGMSASRAAVLNISSMGGSITRTGVEFTPVEDLAYCGYKTSKAALNMSMRVIAANVKSKGILVVNICPGWVKTDMGSEQAEITPEESISTMLETLTKLNDTHQGAFLNRHGIAYAF